MTDEEENVFEQGVDVWQQDRLCAHASVESIRGHLAVKQHVFNSTGSHATSRVELEPSELRELAAAYMAAADACERQRQDATSLRVVA